MATCETGNKLVENGNRPTDAIMCMSCCTSLDTVPIGANQCLDPGWIMYLDAGVWKRVPDGVLSGGYATADYGVLYSSVNTMDGNVGRGVVVRDNARIVTNRLTWGTGNSDTNKGVILDLLDARSVKATAVAV